jgi:hypothetical protein
MKYRTNHPFPMRQLERWYAKVVAKVDRAALQLQQKEEKAKGGGKNKKGKKGGSKIGVGSGDGVGGAGSGRQGEGGGKNGRTAGHSGSGGGVRRCAGFAPGTAGPIVVLLEDFECFDQRTLNGLLHTCLLYRETLPIQFVVSIPLLDSTALLDSTLLSVPPQCPPSVCPLSGLSSNFVAQPTPRPAVLIYVVFQFGLSSPALGASSQLMPRSMSTLIWAQRFFLSSPHECLEEVCSALLVDGGLQSALPIRLNERLSDWLIHGHFLASSLSVDSFVHVSRGTASRAKSRAMI